MNLAEAKQYLLTCQTLSVTGQQRCESAIVAAFQMFWSSYPELEEFTQHMKGIVLFPAILYCMVADRPLISYQELTQRCIDLQVEVERLQARDELPWHRGMR